MKWMKEIKAVGIKDWLWFVLCLKRNEFHSSLDKIKIVDDRYLLEERQNRRQRAHKIDEILSDLDGWKKAVTLLHKNKVNRRFLS